MNLPKNKIRILHVIRQGRIGGGETHVLQLVNYLPKNAFTNIVLSFSEGEMIDELNKNETENFVIHTNFPFDIRKWFSVYRLLKKINPEIIHAHGTRACSNVFIIARYLGIPLVYTVHGWSFHPGNSALINFFRKKSEKFLIKKSNKTINVSYSDQKLAINELNFAQSIVIQNGVDNSKFNSDIKFEDIRPKLEIPEDAIIFALIARITKQKNPEILLNAFQKSSLYKQNCFLLFIGDGDMKPIIVKKTIEMGLSNFVKFVPFQKDVRPFLSGIDIFCLPSFWEGLPIGLLEAVSMDKIILASNIDSNMEVVEHDPHSFHFSPKNVDELRHSMEELINVHMKDNIRITREKLRQKYSISRMIEELHKLYNSML